MKAYASLAPLALIAALLASYGTAIWKNLASCAELYAWLPTWNEFVIDFYTVIPQPNDDLGDPKLRAIFDAIPNCDFCFDNWWLVLTVCIGYLVSIPTLKAFMRNREKIYATNCVVSWNLFLSIFSCFGMLFVVPQLLTRLFTEGLESSVCSAAREYGHAYVGFFIYAFIMSKLFEVVDTFWLLIRKSSILALQWYHHATVMLFCWHAYAIRTGYAGMWYAGMNYTVHTFMYLYFAAQMGPQWTRAWAKPFALTITMSQILQMMMGMVVLMVSMTAQAKGRTCHNSKSNTILGLIMYFSYFVLFAKLFLEYYVFGGKEKKDAERRRQESERRKLSGAKESNGNGSKESNGHGEKVKEIDTVKEARKATVRTQTPRKDTSR